MEGRIVLICISLIIFFCTTSCTEKSTQSQPNSEQEIADEAVIAIIKIFNGSMEYRQDYSEDPRDVSDLITLEYCVIDVQTGNQWDFSLIGQNPFTGINAMSNTELPYGEGKSISFSHQTGKFSGWFCDHPKPEEDFAGEAQRVIKALYNSLKMYCQDYGENPERGPEDLFDLEYLEIVEWVFNEWVFSFEGSDTITAINAVSTSLMDYGEGKEISFSLQTGRYSGWLSENAKYEKDFSYEAKIAISYLGRALSLYHEEFGVDPVGDAEGLFKFGYSQPEEWVVSEWNFYFVGSDTITGISAISTAQMEYGEGKLIHFDLTQMEYSGWVFTDETVELMVSSYIQYVWGARVRD